MKALLALLGYALGSLRRRLGRTLSVGFALALVTAAYASAVFLTDALREEARRELAALPDLTVIRLHGGRPATVARADAAPLARIEGVLAVRDRVWGYLFVEALAANVAVVGTPALTQAELGALTRGRRPPTGARGWALVGEGVARTLGLRPGDGLSLDTPSGRPLDLRVTGTFRASTALRTADVLLLDERDARVLLGFGPEEATDLAVTLGNPDESAVAARKVLAAMPGVRVLERRLLGRVYDLTYDRRGGLVALALLPALLALLVLVWDRATGLSAEERREVGVLKSVGWSTRDVLATRMLEALVVAFVATAVGAAAAYGYVFPLGAPGLREALLGWSTLQPRLELAPAVTGTQLVTLAALVAAPYLCACVVPSWRAATLDPADAMRDG